MFGAMTRAAEHETDGKTTVAKRLYIALVPLDAKRFAAAVRAHWTIENQLHWVTDAVSHDDLCRSRARHAPYNMATVRQIALNLIKAANDTKHQGPTKKAAWSVDCVETIIRKSA